MEREVKKQSWLGEVHIEGEDPHWTVGPSKKKEEEKKKKKKKKKKEEEEKEKKRIRNRFSPLPYMLPVMTIRICFTNLIVFGDEWNFNKTFMMQLSQHSVTPLS